MAGQSKINHAHTHVTGIRWSHFSQARTKKKTLQGRDMVKRLLIKASNNYENGFQIVPVNTGKPMEIATGIGVFTFVVNIKGFDGCEQHKNNSCYNPGDTKYLDGSNRGESGEEINTGSTQQNVGITMSFRPLSPIKGNELLFGNDLTRPIYEYVPARILDAGLKFFTFFINRSTKGDVYSNKPYLYSLALNTFSYTGILNSSKQETGRPVEENLCDNIDNVLDIPRDSGKRRAFFNDMSHCESFVFYNGKDYILEFKTSLMKMSDSNYAVSIPTFRQRTFDIDVSRYANEKLNNFNWVVKQGGFEGVGYGKNGLILNFSLVDED